MTNCLKKILIIITSTFLVSCSNVLQSISLDLDSKDTISQEDFLVVQKTLTIAEAKSKNSQPFIRLMVQTGVGNTARIISENEARRAKFPVFREPDKYKIGIGDTLTFTKLVENSNTTNLRANYLSPPEREEPYILGIGDQITLIQVNELTSNTLSLNSGSSNNQIESNTNALAALENLSSEKGVIQTSGRIGSDGSVLLLEVGRLEALGKTINALRSEVRNIFIRNGISPKFQLEITAFNSQKAYLTINSAGSSLDNSLTEENGNIIKLTDQPLTLREILSKSGIAQKPGYPTRVLLHRLKTVYLFELEEIYAAGAQEIIIRDRDHIFVEVGVSNISETVVTVGSDGTVILPDVGKLRVNGRTIAEIEVAIKNSQKLTPRKWENFQLRVTGFNSQRVVLSIPKFEGSTDIASKVITLDDRNLRLDELLTQNGVTIHKNKLTIIYLLRGKKEYKFLLSDLLEDPTKIIYLQPDDRIRVELLAYKNSKVFITGSGLKPKIFSILPENRETLADALFTQGGALESTSAKRSDIYLLRGRDPVTAFHLDALNPSRLLVAEAMELRPNDIIFVSEQPIISFNRTLQTLFPLRILLRDIDNQNIP